MIVLPAIALVLSVWTAPADAAPARAVPSVCRSEVGAFRYTLNDDLRGRILEPSVYGTILAELGPVAEACRLGQDAEAGKLLRALKRRWRYQ
jgi:hypothetical protein